MDLKLYDKLIVKNESKIVFFILDGLGGLEGTEGTELQVAHIPHFDKLAEQSVCGVLDPVGPGIIPGSGPGHFAIFGYDPIESNVGRGILSAMGVNFDLRENDVAARVNFATIDQEGRVVDRRAGRPSDEQNERVCEKITKHLAAPIDNVEIFFKKEKEHRAVLILRGPNLSGDLTDTDPQKTGVVPSPVEPLHEEARKTANVVNDFTSQVKKILSDEEKMNMILLRGFDKYRRYPSLQERFGLKSLAIASYPMYQGMARLLGMDVQPSSANLNEQIEVLEKKFSDYDFFYVHLKATDAAGEDGDFQRKVKILEEVDELLPRVTRLNPDVLVITGDHSTPSRLAAHSWHPVPALLYSRFCRADSVKKFDEVSCIPGGLSGMPMKYLMGVALANAGRLAKFGA
ncbi:MAG: 2,3-bisphosphoglycerate-independent phosphoglycerate mutase [Candidatus Tectomicrobia bacterium]|nr:2,3-bisphosphoglycerate-independent phosphoglycerate mutase [Candidatus Tectomicrobia bacterium]